MIFSKINYYLLIFVVDQWLCHVQLFETQWTAACQASLSFTISRCLLKLKSIEFVMPMNHLTLSSPYLLAFYFSPASGSFSLSWLFTLGGQGIGASASALVLPVNIQDWFPLGLTGLISLQSKGFSRVFSNTTVQKHQFFGSQPSLWFTFHRHTWLLEKSWLWLDGPFSAKSCLCFF